MRTFSYSLIFMNLLLCFTSFAAGNCPTQVGINDLFSQSWGIDVRNTRYQPRSKINKDNVNSLVLDWVFALDEGSSPHSYPLITEDTVFVGTDSANLYALAKRSGCVRWVYEADSPIRTGIVSGMVQTPKGATLALFFGTFSGDAYAVDAVTGAEIWRADIKDHPFNAVTGTPIFHEGHVFVPVSSMEGALALNPFYGCCKSSGGLVSLNANTGEQIWRTKTVAEEPQVVGQHFFFVEEWGPSGAPVWSAPTIDQTRNLIYLGTGGNYTRPASDTSDAIMALNLEDGVVRWIQQYTELDAINMSCGIPNHPNCPEDAGPDLDFGAPPIIAKISSTKDILLAGQKSGGVYGLDPDTGKRLWSKQFGRGGMLGGVHWGMAVNERLGLLYAPISDVGTGPTEQTADPGLNAVDIETGEVRWSTPNSNKCTDKPSCAPGLSAAILATDDLVFAAGLDGYLYVYDATSGEIVWSYDTWREFESVNGLPVNGGTVDVHGPMIADDRLFIQSGYSTFGYGGNALIVFKLGEEK